ncbi:prophage regulatory protein [Paraburkholderia atlantica]|uniref:helix-turn-helix transcriptional regulator n=1 Tax=Paraburkholderia atlantica TaxID=2654982 RepID=UPI003D1C27FD
MAKEAKKVIVTMKPLCLDLEASAQAVSLSPSVIKKLVREGKFPKPRQLSERRVGWLVRELEEWLEARPVSDILPLSLGMP